MIPFLRRILALVIATALVAAGVVLIVEVVAGWFDSGPVVLSKTATATWRTTQWDDTPVIWTAIIVGVIGLLCLVVACWPDRPTTIPSHIDDVELERRPLEAALRRQLVAVDGVADARVTTRRGRPRARVDTNRMLDTDAVRAASQQRLSDLTQRWSVRDEPTLDLRAKRAAP